MIRRGRLSPKRLRQPLGSPSNDPRLLHAKGTPRHRERKAVEAQQTTARRRCRQQVRQRDGECRALCGETVWRRLEVHEEPPRSQGGDPTDPNDCIALCHSCHTMRTGRTGLRQPILKITPLHPQLRCSGPVEFTIGRHKWVTEPRHGGTVLIAGERPMSDSNGNQPTQQPAQPSKTERTETTTRTERTERSPDGRRQGDKKGDQ